MASVHGLDKLHQAITEALEFEKCCICLEKLQKCVILWPCSHRFCNDCILAYLVSVHGDKIPCPLCKRLTTRRSILNFQDRQQEFEDSLQTLIGNISLDLGFDITSVQPFKKTKVTSDDKNKIRVPSPVRRTRSKSSRNIHNEQKTNTINCGNKRSTESPVNAQDFKSQNISPCSVTLHDVIKNMSPQSEKVNQWLNSTHFSQGESPNISNTVVADVHESDLESPMFSDDQLVSVSQVESKTMKKSCKKIQKSLNVSSDINAIKPFDETYKSKRLKKSFQDKSNEESYKSEKFDQLLCPEKKYQIISETYQRRNLRERKCTRGRRFDIDTNLFKPDENNTEKGKMSDSDKHEDSSEKSLEDFSSGSGEEWDAEEESNKGLSSKNKTLKNIKRLTKSKDKSIGSENQVLKRVNNNNMKIAKNKKSKTLLTNNKCLVNFLNNNNEKDKLNKGKINSSTNNYNKTENDSTKSDETVKRIIDDWDDYKRTNILNMPSLNEIQSRNVRTHVQSNTSVELTPVKQDNQRSPGWSRLKNTKKEFHMSERKKLSLKTLSKSNSTISTNKASPLNKGNNSFDDINQSFNDRKENKVSDPLISQCKGLLNKVEKEDVMLKEQTTTISSAVDETFPKINSDESKSLSNSDPLFKGFSTQEQNKSDLKKLEMLNVEKCGEAPITNKKTVLSENIHSQVELSTGLVSQENLENDLHNANSKTSFMEVDAEQDYRIEVRSPKISGQKNCVTDKKLELAINSSCRNSNGETERKIVCVNNEQINPQQIKMMKRDRDPDLHNSSSSICSPERKRKCQDAGVQTSPGRMQSLIQDILKNIWGIEAEQKLAIICNGSNRKLHFDEDNLQSTSSNVQNKSCGKDDEESNNTMTQYARNSNENLSYSKKCQNDSDFVLGTENIEFSLSNILNKHCNKEAREIGSAMDSSNILKEKSVLTNNDVEVDPDAPTQPYKTPVVPKRPFVTSTSNVYSAVSNPTESELKRVNEIFENNDVLFPDATPIKATPLNCSGIGQLESFTTNLNKQLDSFSHSPSKACKEKSNKSRRQLDFLVDDNTNSNDMFTAEHLEEMPGKTKPKPTKDSQNCNTHNSEIISIVNDSKKESLCISMDKENVNDNITENVSLNSDSIILKEDDKFFTKQTKYDITKLSQDQVISSQVNDLLKCNETLTETPDIILPTEEQECSRNPELKVTRGQVTLTYKKKEQECSRNPKLKVTRGQVTITYKNKGSQRHVLSSPMENSNNEEKLDNNKKDSNVDSPTFSLGQLVEHQVTNRLQKAIVESTDKLDKDHRNELQYNNLLVASNKPESTVDLQGCQDEEQTPKHNLNMLDDGPMSPDEVSNASSEDLFVEGTPSQIKTYVNHKKQNQCEMLEESNKVDSTNLTEKFSEKPVHSVSNNFEQHSVTESTNMEHEHIQKVTTRTENTENKNCEQSEIVESSQSETDESENYCFSSSLLTPHQNQVLGYVLSNLNIPFSKTVGNHISHLIVSNSGGYAQHSHKFLLAMALHKQIIKYDWIEQVIKTRRLVPLEDYLAVDRNGVCGVLRAKEDVKRELLQNFAIHIYNTIDKEIQRHQIEEIITLCGGTLVTDLHQFPAVSRSMARVILLCKYVEVNSEAEELLKCRDMYKAPLVEVSWLYDTISQYRVLPLEEYISMQSTSS